MNQLNKFNGSDHYVSLGDYIERRALVSHRFTIEAWVKESIPHEWTGIVGLTGGASGHEEGWTLGITFDRRFTFGVATSENIGHQLGQSKLNYIKAWHSHQADKWHHVAGVFDGVSLKLYVDGVLANEHTPKGKGAAGLVQWPTSGELLVGAFDNGQGVLPFSGYICEVRLWGCVRSAEQILAGKHVRPDPEAETDLVGYWPLCDGVGLDGQGRHLEDWTGHQAGTLKGGKANWQDEAGPELSGYYPLQPPELNSPGEADSRCFTLNWQAQDNADAYLLDVATDEAFTEWVKGYENKKVKGTSVRVSRLAEDTLYYYRLRSVANAIEGQKASSGNIRTAERTLPSAGFALAVNDGNSVLKVDYQQQLLSRIPRHITIQAWVKANANTTDSYFSIVNQSTDRQGWRLGSYNNCYTFSLSGKDSKDGRGLGRLTSVSSVTPVKAAQWVHLTGVYNGSELKLYVDGKLEVTATNVAGDIYYPPFDETDSSHSKLLIGGYLSGGNVIASKANLAEIRLFNRELDTAEIGNTIDRRLEPGEYPNLLSYWRCDRGEGNVVKDIASGHHGRAHADSNKIINWVRADLPLSYPLRQVSQLAVGASHTLALDDNGLVWAWGNNSHGQLGDGTTTTQEKPALVKNKDGQYLADIKQVAIGQDFSLALTHTGKVYAWGANDYGELAQGNQTAQSYPVAVPHLPVITAIAANTFHAMALSDEGKVIVWGRNNKGQLGDGTTINRSGPVVVNGLARISAIAAGQNHCVALDDGGTVFCWGLNANGQLGNNTTTDSLRPIKACDSSGIAISGAQSVSAGQNNTLILGSGRELLAWGAQSNSKTATAVLDGAGKAQVWSWKRIDPDGLILPGATAGQLLVCRAGEIDVSSRDFDKLKDKFGVVRFNPQTTQVQTSNGSQWLTCGITLPEVPSKINGSTSLFPGASETQCSVDAVADATGYQWQLPPGSAFISGQNTAAVKLKVGAGGELSVVAFNDHGQSRQCKVQLSVSAKSQTFNYSGAMQTFTVPAGVTRLRIEAHGAQGGSDGGRGARMRGDVTVTPGEQLKVLVGGQGTAVSQYQSGGGGGSFVTRLNNSPLVIAGGGGGRSRPFNHNAMHATTTQNGLGAVEQYPQYQRSTGAGGSSGAGGQGNGAGGGAGLNSNGSRSRHGQIAQAFVNGARATGYGGFGGGGPQSQYGGGGGGGYSGGGGSTYYYSVGGGGGSYNVGTEQSNTGASRNGHGMVVIQY